MSEEEPDYAQWVALREYLRSARIEMRDPQVRNWVEQWTGQIDDRLVVAGQSYRVCQTCDRGGHTCPGCGADVAHGRIACADCSGREEPEPKQIPVKQLVTGDSVYSPSTQTWHEVRRESSGQLYFERDGVWMSVSFGPDVLFLTRRGETGAKAGLMFDALGGEVIEG